MADTKSSGYLIPQMMPVDGRAIFIPDKADVASAPAVNDTVSFRLPAGLELSQLRFVVPDMDTNGSPALAGKIGYKAVDPASALVADDDYFRATGALGQAAGLVDCSFPPITFQEDVMVQITWTTVAATFAAGTVHMIAAGNAKGPR